MPRILPREDEEISKELTKELTKAGIKIKTNVKFESIAVAGKGVKVKLPDETLEVDQVLVAALVGGQVHEVPGEERVGQGHVGVDARRGERVAVEVNAFFEIAALGDAPLPRDGMMTDVGEEEEIAVPVMQSLAEVDTRAMQRVDERGFHEARFVDGAARRVIRTRRPFNHPMKDFELTKLRQPMRDTIGAQIIYEGMLAGSRANRQ